LCRQINALETTTEWFEELLSLCGSKQPEYSRCLMGIDTPLGLAELAPTIQCFGIWSDGNRFATIEAYPSVCKKSTIIRKLMGPDKSVRVTEGWIWGPRDGLRT